MKHGKGNELFDQGKRKAPKLSTWIVTLVRGNSDSSVPTSEPCCLILRDPPRARRIREKVTRGYTEKPRYKFNISTWKAKDKR